MDATAEIQKVASMRGDSGSIWRRGDDVFSRSSREEDDEEALRWAALEKLPTYDRVRRAILPPLDGEPPASASGVLRGQGHHWACNYAQTTRYIYPHIFYCHCNVREYLLLPPVSID